MSHIHELLLEPGMAVEVRGQLVFLDDEPVITGLDMVPHKPGQRPVLRWHSTPYVRIDEVEALGSALSELMGLTIFGRGTWTGASVHFDELVGDATWAKIPTHEYQYRDDSPTPPHVRTVEAPLFADGLMLRRVRLREGDDLRIIVSATDPERVQRALEPIYGDALEIYRSPWTASQIRGLDDVLHTLPDERVLKIKYRMDEFGVLSRKLRVDYVDDELVRALRSFPSDLLFIEAVVEPAGTAQDRDLYRPIRPRQTLPGEIPSAIPAADD